MKNIIKNHGKALGVSILLLVAGLMMKILGIGESDSFSLGGTIGGLGTLFLVLALMTAIRTSGKKDRVAEDERTKKIYGKAAISALVVSLPLSFIFGAYLSSNAKIMTVVTPMTMLLIPIGFFAVAYVITYNYYSRKE